MMDKLFPDIQVRCNKLISTFEDLHHMKLRITQGLRTFSEQEDLYERGRTLPGPVVTYAFPGMSFHNYGLAFDCAFIGSDPYLERIDPEDSDFYWKEYGKLAEGFGLEWGGRFTSPDRPHCQKSYGFTIHELKQIHDDFGLSVVWDVISKKIKKEIP